MDKLNLALLKNPPVFKSGPLIMQKTSEKTWRERFFKLRNDGLYYHESNRKTEGKLIGTISFKEIKNQENSSSSSSTQFIEKVIVTIKNKKNTALLIKHPELGEFYLSSDSEIDLHDWFKSIKLMTEMKLFDSNQVATDSDNEARIREVDWSDREKVLAEVREKGRYLQYASDELKKDREIVMEAVQQDTFALVYADQSLRGDRDFALQNAKKNGFLFPAFGNDREIVLESVKMGRGWSIKFADESLRKDRGFSLQAVRLNGRSLNYLDESFKKDREITLKAVQQNGVAIEYVDDSFKKDREIVIQAVKQNGSSLKYVDESFHSDMYLYYLYYLSQSQDTARDLNPKLFSIIEKSKNDSTFQKLSRNIQDMYSNDFYEETTLYWIFQYRDYVAETKRTLRLFTNPTYSSQFMEKLIVLQIVKNIFSKDSPIESDSSNSIDSYLFCLRLDNFLEEIKVQPTNRTSLKKVVETVSSKFDISKYSEKEKSSILYFFNEWTRDCESFDNLKELLTRYNNLGREYSKIINAVNRYYFKFKDELVLLSVLGYGGEGVVFKAYSNKFKSLVAFKIKFEREDDVNISNERVEFIKRNDIKGKINCFESGLIDNYLYSVMELGEETLEDYIERNKTTYQTSSMSKGKLIETLTVFMKILDSVQSIHNNNIAHRDLDPKNIVKIRDDYKIIDFETARVVKTGNSITLMIGKEAYMSPEVSSHNYEEVLLNDQEKIGCNNGQITTSCDLFSLGCILLKLLTNCPLRLDKNFSSDSNLQNYGRDYCYFNIYGNFFHQVVITLEGEMKLHHAIEKLIDYDINPIFQVNEYIVRCIITMIQRDPTQRLDCFTHKSLIRSLIDLIQNDYDKSESIEKIHKHLKGYNKVTPLKSYSAMVEDNERLKKKKKEIESELLHRLTETEKEKSDLLQRIKELEEQVNLLKEEKKN